MLEPFVGPGSMLADSTATVAPAPAPRARAAASTASGCRRTARRSPRSPGGGGRAVAGGRPLRTLPRMQALTLEVIMRVVFGARDEQGCATAIRAALDITASLPRLVAMSLSRPARRRGGRSCAPSRDVDARPRAVTRAGRAPGGPRARRADRRGRDRATSCATRSSRCSPPGTRRPRARSRGRSSGSRVTRRSRRACARRRRYLDADGEGGPARAAGALDRRRARRSRRTGRGWTLPPGVHVTPCPYLAHRRAEPWPDPTAFRPERFLDGAPEPWPGCRSAAARAAARAPRSRTWSCARCCARSRPRSRCGPTGRTGERMRRRGVTLVPSRGGRVVAAPMTA